jgi:hypothetical protein
VRSYSTDSLVEAEMTQSAIVTKLEKLLALLGRKDGARQSLNQLLENLFSANLGVV